MNNVKTSFVDQNGSANHLYSRISTIRILCSNLNHVEK